jgi:photosystem II stability/assembly factor-like uncharacterized protein
VSFGGLRYISERAACRRLDFLPPYSWLVQLPRAPGTPRVLFHTTDGGLNWNDVAHLDTAYDVGFRDPSTGWLARRPQNGSPALMVTRDGGLTWAIQVLTLPGGAASGDVNRPEFLGDSAAWICAATMASR